MLCGFRRRVPPRGRPSSVSTCQAANMSALGHKRTLEHASGMSVSPPRADMLSAWGNREDLCVHVLSCALRGPRKVNP